MSLKKLSLLGHEISLKPTEAIECLAQFWMNKLNVRVKPHDELKGKPDDANRLDHEERISQIWHLIFLNFRCL